MYVTVFWRGENIFIKWYSYSMGRYQHMELVQVFFQKIIETEFKVKRMDLEEKAGKADPGVLQDGGRPV